MTLTVVTDAAGVPLYFTDDGVAAPKALGTEQMDGNLVIGGTLSIGGTVAASGGLVGSGRSRFSTIPIGGVAYGSLGTDGVLVAGTIYVADIFITHDITLTGIGMLQGGVSATDKWIYALYASAGGAALAHTDLTGVVADGNTDAFLEIPFTATYDAKGPARYWIAVQCNGTTTKNRKIAADTYVDVLCTGQTGSSFGTLGALTPPTAFEATKGPIAYVY